ncbi:restriction endonuclease subunit S [Primorskyibacter marinus]|uniref:restriction endonuclease subunit S n=1 Tax=Primorskyibacter marinus TaxID=1977320 RepID=UPI000E2FF87D|nr:restriction endonuclease subunit S [Primorskyibacter marinus]
MSEMKLRHLADIQNSNVDKVIIEGEQPVRLCNYVDVYKNDFITPDMEFNPGSATRTEIDRFRVKVGDVIITKDSEDRHDIGVPAYVRKTADDLVCGYHLTMLRAFKNRADGAFLFWALQSKPAKEAFAIAANGVTRYGLTQEGIKGLPLWVPNLPTQKRIAAYLDRETARIDELIAKKERLVDLLQERGSAAREELLWGEGPISKLGHHISILPGYAFASASFSDNPEDIRLLRGANVGVDEVRWDDTVYWPASEVKGVERFRLKAGDLVMGMDRPWISGGIRVAEVQESDLPCLLLQRVCKISPRKTLEARYLKSMLESKKFVAYFEPILTGVSVPHISGDQISNFRFPFVGVDEQIRRMDHLEKITRSIQPITRATQISTDRLREYRAALITAAVTGQLDVETYCKAGTTSETLDRIEEEMQA